VKYNNPSWCTNEAKRFMFLKMVKIIPKSRYFFVAIQVTSVFRHQLTT